MNAPKHILVPTDFSEYGDAAVEYAVQIAGWLGATVHLLHVVGVSAYGAPQLGIARTATLLQEGLADAQRELDSLADRLRDRTKVGHVRIEIGEPRRAIDQVATEIGADLIVMGTHGRRGVSRWFLGSVAETVVRTAPCPVLTVHRQAA